MMVDFDIIPKDHDREDAALPENDQRWPSHCACGYEFAKSDKWQLFTQRLYARKDTGEVMTLRDAPVGAMWNADWYPDVWKGKDGMSLMVRCPDGHDWCIDARASNCGLPKDNDHRCWIRHGVAPNITVNKACPGDNADRTCNAGSGSIQTGKWHGFLRNGEFVRC